MLIEEQPADRRPRMTSPRPASVAGGMSFDSVCKLLHISTSPTPVKPILVQQQQAKKMAACSVVLFADTDFRTHIVRELYDTENSYVESLQILEKYYSTLQRNEDLVEKTLSENMFYQIPSIKLHHETLLMQLKHRIEHWDTRPKIGDLIVDTFTKEAVIDTYTAFINNWKTAKEAIKLAKTTRPCFVRCLEEWTREHRGKLNLDALLIMPVQRIPRYELLIKELLKHTPEDHPDRVDLESAQSELHDLALKINAMEHEVDEAERMMIRLKELEMYIDGLSDLVEPNRKFVKFDMVTMSSGMGMKKDRCLFLFSDLLIITNLKRKSGTIRKPSTHSCSPQLYPTLETNKYKLLMRVSLEDLELAKPVLLVPKKPFTNERELLECDLGVLSKISDLTGNLSASHQPLDDALRNMMAQVSRQLSERQAHANDPALSKVELTVATQNGLETVSVTFLSPNKRNTWERAFLEAKQALSLSADRRPPPDFLNPIPIRKTRAGLQLTCVATTSDLNVHDLKDVWVCNSDGYVGQVCVLSMQPEPALTSCVAVSNCKITCIASVPTSATMHKGGALLNSGNISPISDHSSSGDTNNDPLSSCITMELNSDDSSDEDNSLDEHSRSCPSDKETFPMSLSEDEMLAATKAHHIPDPTQGTMWIGMEDGRIFVYYCNDNIRIKKPRIKVQLPSAVHCITSTEHSVLVGLGNGQVAAFHRPAQGFWETLHPSYVDLGPSAAPVQRMIVVCGRLWCACLNMIHVINLSTLKIETSFPVVTDPSRHVTDMVSSGLGVWVSVQNSVVLRLCNALTYDFIADLNLTPSVQKMLAGCDDILRQHKFACLRVTAMLTCKDLLWVGTSAGVIMTINAPHVVQGMGKLSSMPTVTGIWHGHTGQVRFLHCLEQNSTAAIPIPSTRRSIRRDHRRHSIASAATMNKMIVISGGDGYEDFRCTPAHPATPTAITATAVVDNSGRDDSTNHLLLWQC
ncbi:Rho guanine nucleotide exchange factor 17 [Hypsibius exemplaris]|uniref:Rho guanine nucleotide exchange factor 17 n=1 Tax=Hypsibius exemplaris TaxID=2072580 RepID=A0A1W0WZ96_HYPEX|nr:Rho guanine nucleotide exchange factor 17 [Hypsibius exemplaris]